MLSKHMPIYCFSLAYASFEYGFVEHMFRLMFEGNITYSYILCIQKY
jgi:hypothetical protein